jgi:hypothetical protein
VRRYTVVWTSDVQDDFIDRWIAGDSATRHRLTVVANRVDQELAAAPEKRGSPHSLEPEWRVCELFADVAARIVYQVVPDDRIVRVLSISLVLDPNS